MPCLTNPRHEAFAAALAQGMTADAAYVEAGYKADRGHASRLAAKGNIQERVAQIQAKAAIRVEMTAADIVEQLSEDRKFARSLGQSRAAIAATMGQAKVLGLITDKVEAKVDDKRTVPTHQDVAASKRDWRPTAANAA